MERGQLLAALLAVVGAVWGAVAWSRFRRSIEHLLRAILEELRKGHQQPPSGPPTAAGGARGPGADTGDPLE